MKDAMKAVAQATQQFRGDREFVFDLKSLNPVFDRDTGLLKVYVRTYEGPVFDQHYAEGLRGDFGPVAEFILDTARQAIEEQVVAQIIGQARVK